MSTAPSVAAGSRFAAATHFRAVGSSSPPTGSMWMRAVEGERRVVLGRDIGGVLDPEPADDMTLDVETQDVAGVGPYLVCARGELDAARLASHTSLHLRLH